MLPKMHIAVQKRLAAADKLIAPGERVFIPFPFALHSTRELSPFLKTAITVMHLPCKSVRANMEDLAESKFKCVVLPPGDMPLPTLQSDFHAAWMIGCAPPMQHHALADCFVGIYVGCIKYSGAGSTTHGYAA